MEYAKDSAFVKDFILRTKENLCCDMHPYEITQFVNSLVGLLVLPKEKYYSNIQNSMVDPKLLEEINLRIIVGRSNKYYNLKQIVRHMRNAISHFHLECKADLNSHEIDRIIFSDYDAEGETLRFQIDLSVDLVRKFVDQFSDAIARSIAPDVD